ncbi:MAG: RdgB/HAM1 family non-canonical purine NTP pyrophosphatase [Gammaproteobacteria bacterium]|jgi:XTP/dITP diphosphohydrolase|nr:RdgB/HAM1 family non-canonical purine NTP pyrophosphatase [Gammaproteobacteria bacterium]MBT5723996.1 RdgB/HAM1 family non-canonical purine NTP pyrophosphatase [Gammaproteobacteria bacterium]MBT7879638.1 RdgB/HAM1 family non-canonical purine NTP pyrophosphatase [Gammaproteobacteria bacterium]MDG1233145.1 RdgB/HAM1 family non-canonical purine NTP pyrophosphatase [Pseudomonadales bacterium]
MKFVLASGNQHKADEIGALLPAHFELVLQKDLGVESPIETGTTFIENAIIKAKHASLATGLPAIADDSGLCVPFLSGDPGIYSARYAGPEATDIDNLLKLRSALEGASDRRAFFYCVLVYMEAAEDPTPIITEARWEGEIANEPSGDQGFGYDPIFRIPSLGKTAAELSSEQKNSISHRGQALAALSGQLSYRYAT